MEHRRQSQSWLNHAPVHITKFIRDMISQTTRTKVVSNRTISDVVEKSSKLKSGGKSVKRTSQKGGISFHRQLLILTMTRVVVEVWMPQYASSS